MCNFLSLRENHMPMPMEVLPLKYREWFLKNLFFCHCQGLKERKKEIRQMVSGCGVNNLVLSVYDKIMFSTLSNG